MGQIRERASVPGYPRMSGGDSPGRGGVATVQVGSIQGVRQYLIILRYFRLEHKANRLWIPMDSTFNLQKVNLEEVFHDIYNVICSLRNG